LIDGILDGSCLRQASFVLGLSIGELPRGCFHLGGVPLLGVVKILLERRKGVCRLR
jgi:hypothetical protein